MFSKGPNCDNSGKSKRNISRVIKFPSPGMRIDLI